MKRQEDLKSPPLDIDKVKTVDQAMSNCLFVSPVLFKQFFDANNKKEPIYVRLNEFVFILKSEKVDDNKVAVPANIRTGLKLSPTMDHPILTYYELPNQLFMLGSLKMSVTCPTLKPDEKVEISEEELIKEFRQRFSKHFVGSQQEFYLQLNVP